MARDTFATIGILAVLLLGIGMISAYTTTTNNIILTTYNNSLTNVSAGETYDFEATIENLNGTDYNVSFGTSSWTWNTTGEVITNGTSKTFKGTLTIPVSEPATKSIIANIHDPANNSNILFQLLKSISLSYYNDTTEILGCTDDSYDNYDEDATVDDGSCENDPISGYNFCSNGKQGDLIIADVEFTNLGEGEDDDWFLLDEIEIEVEIENTHNTENVRNVLVEIMIYDSNDNDVTNDFEFKDEEINLNTIRDDDSEFVTFRIEEIPADLDSGYYKVYIKAYSEDDESEQCVAEAASKYLNHQLYQRIEVTREDDPAVIMKDNNQKISVSCGDDNVALPLSIYNLGSDKEKKVLVTVINSALGLYEKIIIDNLKSGRRKDITFYFDMPQELSRNTYTLDVMTYYDYDDDEDEDDEFSYSENSDDDLDKDFSVRLEILSCRGPEPTINANLDSVAEIGTDLVIKAIITNNGEDNNFIISISDFESWADIVSVTPQSASINKGEFIEVTITLKPKVAGTQSFNINAIVNGESYDQLVSVNIDKKGLFGGMSNAVTYTIIAIIAVLILISLVLIAKVSRKSAKPQF